MPIFLSGRPDDLAPPEQPANSSQQPEPLKGNKFNSHTEMGRDENGASEDWGLNGGADTEDDGEGQDHNHLRIQRLETSLNVFVCSRWRLKIVFELCCWNFSPHWNLSRSAFADDQLTWDCQFDSLFQMVSKEEAHRKDQVNDTRWLPGWNSCRRLPHSSFCHLCTGQLQPSSMATRSSSRLGSRKGLELGVQPGIKAWKRWTLWRQSQTNLYLVSGAFLTIFFSSFT